MMAMGTDTDNNQLSGTSDLLIRSGCSVWALLYHGAGTSEPPPVNHGVSPSHPMDDQFCGNPAFSTKGRDFGTVYLLT